MAGAGMPVDAQLSGLPLLEVHAHLNGSLTKEVVRECASWKEGVPGLCEDLINLKSPSFTELSIHESTLRPTVSYVGMRARHLVGQGYTNGASGQEIVLNPNEGGLTTAGGDKYYLK